jgi:hypothetical protein
MNDAAAVAFDQFVFWHVSRENRHVRVAPPSPMHGRISHVRDPWM